MSDQRIEVDRETCMGLGVCVMYAPATFAHDTDAKAYVLNTAGDPPEQIGIAMEACPTGAIGYVSQGQLR